MFYIVMFSLSTFIIYFFFFFNDTATTEIYTLSLHDALPILFASFWCNSSLHSSTTRIAARPASAHSSASFTTSSRSEEHTSELQSRQYLVCRLLLEKKKKIE